MNAETYNLLFLRNLLVASGYGGRDSPGSVFWMLGDILYMALSLNTESAYIYKSQLAKNSLGGFWDSRKGPLLPDDLLILEPGNHGDNQILKGSRRT